MTACGNLPGVSAHVRPLSQRAQTALLGGFLILSIWFVFSAATNRLPGAWLTQGWIEAVGIVFSVLFAWLEVRESAWNWPAAIVASVAYIEYFRRSGFFANMWLQLYYVVVSVLGWYWWLKGGEQKTSLPITRANPKVWGLFAIVLAVAVPVYLWLMRVFKGQPQPLDIITAVLSIGGEILLARKILETWWVWIVVNVLTVVMLYQSPFSAGLYVFFLVLSVLGLVEWRRALRKSQGRLESS